MLVVYSVGEVMSDLFGLEDASDFLEGWCVWASASADFTCYINYIPIFLQPRKFN